MNCANHGSLRVLAILAVAASNLAQAQVKPQEDGVQLYTTLQRQHDDNLFRLPDDFDLTLLSGQATSRSDDITNITAGLNGQWSLGLQRINLDAVFTDQHFADNDLFNNQGGNAKLNWQWALGSDWSGVLGASYARSLAGFANNRVVGKDVLSVIGYNGLMRYRLGNNWRLQVAGQASRSDHSLALRQFDNAKYHNVSGGVEYDTGSGSVVGWDYRIAKGSFPDAAVTPSVRDYEDRASTLRATYIWSVKTKLEGNVGYVRRRFDQDPGSDYSGSTWMLKATWAPTDSTQLALKGWRELQANQDAESDYFVAKGLSATLSWAPSDLWLWSLQGADVTRDYRLSSGAVLADSLRRDKIKSLTGALTYSPRDWLHLNAGYSYEQRDSNRPEWQYDDRIVQLALTLTF